MKKLFLSYHFGEDLIVHRISYHLNKQPGVDAFCWAGKDRPNREDWINIVGDVLRMCNAFIFFVSDKIGDTQKDELRVFSERPGDGSFIVVKLGEASESLLHDEEIKRYCDKLGWRENDWTTVPAAPLFPRRNHSVCFSEIEAFEKEVNNWEKRAGECAEKIVRSLNCKKWMDSDGLPIGYPFDYEKTIIEEYVAGDGILKNAQAIQKGCSILWPSVERFSPIDKDNPISSEMTGERLPDDSKVLVDVRSRYHSLPAAMPEDSGKCLLKSGLSFVEARPRERLLYPRERAPLLKIGIVVSGGIAPGINAVINGIYHRHLQYSESWKSNARHQNYECEFVLYRDGFAGVLQGRGMRLEPNELRDQRNLGGSLISTSRKDDLLDVADPEIRQGLLNTIVDQVCHQDSISILYVIGGEGTMRAAHAIHNKANKDGNDFSLTVVAIPKTMDNDILWVWQAFGFLSAVEKAKEFVMQLHTETKSNPRLCVVQLFGSDSGFVVNHTALGAGTCKAVLIPEVAYTMRALSSEIREWLWDPKNFGDESPHGIILLAETAVPSDVEDYIDHPQYENVGLEESEKTEIRRFVGSALLCSDELWWKPKAKTIINISNDEKWKQRARQEWNEVKRALMEQCKEHPQPSYINNLNQAIQNLDAEALNEPRFRSLVTIALNSHIKSSQNFFLESRVTHHTVEMKQLRRIIEDLDTLKNGEIVLRADAEQLLARLRSYPIQHEAREIIRRLDFSRTQDNRKDLIERLVSLMEEYRRRILLEMACPNLIFKREKRYRRERRVFGQTPDNLRTGTLKIVSRVLEIDIKSCKDFSGDYQSKKYWQEFRVFTNEPRHLIRAIDPSVQDIIFGQRLGILAVDNAMAGYTDFMISQWLTEYVLVPLKLVVLGRKRVPPSGIFWKSVLASTQQSPDMW